MKGWLRALSPRKAAKAVDIAKSQESLTEAKRRQEELLALLTPRARARAREIFAQVVAEAVNRG